MSIACKGFLAPKDLGALDTLHEGGYEGRRTSFSRTDASAKLTSRRTKPLDLPNECGS